MKLQRFRSLNHKVLSYVGWSALALLLAAAFVSFCVQYKHSRVNTVSILNQLLDTVENTVSVAAYSKNKNIAEEVINGLLKNDIVNRVTISCAEGFVLERSRNNDLNSAHEVSRPIYSLFDAKEITGHITIQPSAQYSFTEAKYATVSNIFSSFILISLTSLVILYVIRKYISRPLTFVSNTLHDISSGREKLIPVLKNNMNDELGRLRDDINTLLSTLDEKFNSEYELRQHVESMERAVRHMYNSSSAGLFLLDVHGRLLTANSTLRKIFAIEDLEEREEPCFFADFFKDRRSFETLLSEVLVSNQLESGDFLLADREGIGPVWVHCLLSKIRVSPEKIHLEGVLFDVTRRVEEERAIQHEAAHDPLTGLLNRYAAQEVFERDATYRKACFLMMDLDGFKQANDTHGHLVGDKVLEITSDRLRRCVRSSDIVCRFGGDEFLVILPHCHLPNRSAKIAEQIVASIQQPMFIEKDVIVTVSISVGIADGTIDRVVDFNSMIETADTAMYEVKRHGKNGYCVVDENGEMYTKFFGVDFS